MMAEPKRYIVKTHSGEIVVVLADGWTATAHLEFTREGRVVAYFTAVEYFCEAAED